MKTAFFASIRFLMLGFLLMTSAQAADVASLKLHFHSSYSEDYDSRFCGMNITRLLRRASSMGTNLENAFLVRIENSGFWQLQAFASRGGAEGKRRPLGEFHYVLIADGWVFDHDFANQPTVVRAEDYFRRMFVPTKAHDLPQYDAKKALRNSFTLEFYDATEYLANGERTDGMIYKSMDLREYVDLDRILR